MTVNLARRTEASVAIVALTVALLLLPLRATAACAWVLWRQTDLLESKQTKWDLDSAYESQSKCLDTWRVRTVNRSQEPGAWTRYICLPDTVDPRGPKAK